MRNIFPAFNRWTDDDAVALAIRKFRATCLDLSIFSRVCTKYNTISVPLVPVDCAQACEKASTCLWRTTIVTTTIVVALITIVLSSRFDLIRDSTLNILPRRVMSLKIIKSSDISTHCSKMLSPRVETSWQSDGSAPRVDDLGWRGGGEFS